MLSAADLIWSVLTNVIFVFHVSFVFKFLLQHCDTVSGYTKLTAESRRTSLQKETFSLSLPDRLRSQHSADRLVKHLRRREIDCWLQRPEEIAGCDVTCLRPLWVRAEHSRYLTERILFASFWPCSLLMGECPLSARACRASLSSLRSILVPGNQNISIS